MANQRLINDSERGALKRRLIFGGATLVGLLVMAVLVAATIWPVIDAVETGKTAEYPDVLPRYYSADPGRVFDEVRASVAALEGFEEASFDEANRTVEGVVTGPVFGLEHDLTVRVQVVTEFVTRVRVRSSSRVGKGDLGQNARNIEAFFVEMDRRLGAVRFNPPAAKPVADAPATPDAPADAPATPPEEDAPSE
jgi:uncharacterized protein (DUF1499 family)